METLYDVAILGGGPAGCAGAVYAARKSLKAVIITETFGGQSVVSDAIYNWIGTPVIAGSELAKELRAHVYSFSDQLTITEGARIETIEQGSEKIFIVHTTKGDFKARSILYTLGSGRRKLEAAGADQFEHRGVTYCASCDGPLFTDQDVAVIGGGNAAFESALQLLAYCKSVTLIHRRDEFSADPVTIEKAKANPNFKIITNAIIDEVYGEVFATGLKYHTTTDSAQVDMPIGGIFVEIGGTPNTAPLTGLVELNKHGFIVTNPMTQRTSNEMIWAAGDCTDGLYHQNNIAAGDAVKALEDLYLSI